MHNYDAWRPLRDEPYTYENYASEPIPFGSMYALKSVLYGFTHASATLSLRLQNTAKSHSNQYESYSRGCEDHTK